MHWIRGIDAGQMGQPATSDSLSGVSEASAGAFPGLTRAEVSHSFITTTVRTNPRSHHKGATGRV